MKNLAFFFAAMAGWMIAALPPSIQQGALSTALCLAFAGAFAVLAGIALSNLRDRE